MLLAREARRTARFWQCTRAAAPLLLRGERRSEPSVGAGVGRFVVMLEVLVALLAFIALLVAGAWLLGGVVARFFVRATADFLAAVESERRR